MTLSLATLVGFDILNSLFVITGNIDSVERDFREGPKEAQGNAPQDRTKTTNDTPHFVDTLGRSRVGAFIGSFHQSYLRIAFGIIGLVNAYGIDPESRRS
jgi:hypothetical protein